MATDIMKIGLILTATDRTGGGINSAIGRLGKLAGALGLASAAYAGFDAIKRYDDAIQSLSAVTGVTGQELEDMRGQVLALAKDAKKSGDEIAKSFENVGSNMSEYLKDPKGLRDITAAGIILSKAARMQVAPALDDLTTIMNQFDLKAKDAAKTVNILTAGEIVGNVRTSEISKALQDFGASASDANVNLGESVALIEVLGKKLDKSKIGVAGRNILVAISAAKGLDKEALVQLEKYGVSTDKLMNKQTPLIERLTELSKISGDATAMVKVFGKENITAATILLKNLPLYKNWENQIQNTNEANNQAATNSKSFTNRMKELRATFDNILISNNESTGALSLFGSVLEFVTKHLSFVINTILLALTVYAAYWAYTKIATIATYLYNQALLFQAIAQGKNVIAFARGTVALKAYNVITKVITAAQWLWNAAMSANPIGLIIAGIAALGVGIYFLIKHWDKVIATIKKFGMFLIKMVLKPIIWVLEAIGKLTGAKWAINASASLKKFTEVETVSVAGKTGATPVDVQARIDRNKALIQAAKEKAIERQNIGGGNVTYSPTVYISGQASQTDKENFAKMLKDHKKEIVNIQKEHQNNVARTSFAK